ncbi:methyltransferase-like protein 23 isoform X1 [Panthera tigris]|uniref:methyltransferase-like protein 23 isoform X1 n=1 Tax=Panthera tigris TaxID=9694 RepID=UPI001C6F7588|nr:methyltransferase-like protein 23 isoform X1 [Panthera tigris]
MLGRSGRWRRLLTAVPPLPRPLPLCTSLPEASAHSAARFRRASSRGHLSFLSSLPGLWSLAARPHRPPRGVFPALAVPLRRPDGAREGPRGAGEAAPAGPGVPRVRSLATWRPPLLAARRGATDSPTGERGLRGHVVRAQRFRFSEEPGLGAEGTVLEVSVPQVLHLQYGMYVWPCAVVLAQYLWFHRRSLPGKAVLEIGAGVSLPGIVAAKCGAEVILSDSSELPHCLEICRQSREMNNLPQVRVVGLTWGHVCPNLLALPPQDIILASDVFFEPEDFEDILTTVYFLMQKNPKVQLWSTYQC